MTPKQIVKDMKQICQLVIKYQTYFNTEYVNAYKNMLERIEAHEEKN